MSVDYGKLKTNLNLIMHRLKLVEKKKMELNQKARRTIGEFLTADKVDRARIRVEQIIREDYIVEAMDLVESYCDLLMSRFGQIQANDEVEEGLATAISSLIWVTPYFESDVPELKVISDQLGRKYGKPYFASARDNSVKTVNETLIKKMSVQVPPKLLVEKYLVEIAKDQKIDYKPDPRIMKEQESRFVTPNSNDDDGGLRQRGQPSQAPQQGFNLIDLGDHYPKNPITQPFSPYGGSPPPLPSDPTAGSSQPIGPSNTSVDTTDASAPTEQLPIGFNLKNINDSGSSSDHSGGGKEKSSTPKKVMGVGNVDTSSQQHAINSDGGPPPNYDSVVTPNQTEYFSFSENPDLNDTLPELPPVPTGHNDQAEHLDFEDLTRRFEELKNKKN